MLSELFQVVKPCTIQHPLGRMLVRACTGATVWPLNLGSRNATRWAPQVSTGRLQQCMNSYSFTCMLFLVDFWGVIDYHTAKSRLFGSHLSLAYLANRHLPGLVHYQYMNKFACQFGSRYPGIIESDQKLKACIQAPGQSQRFHNLNDWTMSTMDPISDSIQVALTQLWLEPTRRTAMNMKCIPQTNGGPRGKYWARKPEFAADGHGDKDTIENSSNRATARQIAHESESLRRFRRES